MSIPRLSLLIPPLVAAALLATSPMLPMAWDEGITIERAEGIARWAGRWCMAEAPHPLSAAAIDADWQYTIHIEGHPALPGIVIALGRGATGWLLSPLQAARCGPMALFAIAAGTVFYRTARAWSLTAATLALASLLFLPRLFAHAHFAGVDGPLTSCWMLAWAVFPCARRGPAWAALWGACLGMTFACKITGWFAAIPFAVWLLLVRAPGWRRTLAIGLTTAIFAFLLLNPPLWRHPLGGLAEFFRMNLQRAAREDLNVAILFLGQLYDLHHPLPWWNTLFWTMVTVPVGMLVFLGGGLATLVRERSSRPEGLLLLGHWLVLLAVRALPGAPPHDGVRLFLPSFAMLAVVAGVGGASLITRCGRRWGPPTAALLCLGSLSSLVWYAPQWLSYYNLLIGGLPGATAAGMEPTYYWDALDASTLAWLDRHTAAGAKVAFAAPSEESLRLLRRWGVFRFEHRDEAPGRWQWYVLQRRPSAWSPADAWLIAHGRPVLQKGVRSCGWGPWRLTTPLVEVYPYAEHQAAHDAVSKD